MLKSNVLITGSSGFSAKNLINFLLQKKIGIIGLSRKKNNIKNILNIRYNLEKTNHIIVNTDTIIITAQHHLLKKFKNKKTYVKKNIKIIKNTIKIIKNNKIKKVIFFSTNDINYRPLPEKKKLYIQSKLISEELLIKSFKKKFIRQLFILRLPAILGKNCHPNFLKKTIKKLRYNEKIKLINPNKIYNQYIHINDIEKLIYKILKDKKTKFKVLECYSTGKLSLIQTVKFLKKNLKSDSEIYFCKKNIKKKKKFYFPQEYFNFNFAKNTLKKFILEN
jgi:nucleoside-diphosphate-sugar epimerase